MVKKSLIIILVCTPYLLFAQNTILDTNPPRFKWYQISTPHFNVIFTSEFRDMAEEMANRMESVYQPVSQSLEANPNRISLIMQNHNAVSNGFVTMTPRRSEFNTMPSQDYNYTGVLNWLDQLSVHEYRHVVQFDKSRTGFNKFIHFLFGFEASSSMAHLAVPEWFWEGDAVDIETALTPGGRGRIPNFSVLLRTNTLDRDIFNYHRQYLGSFKYNTPDHYVLGYYYTAYLRRKYGKEIIDKITESSWAWPFLPFRFSERMKRFTGKNLIGNYTGMMTELDSIWKTEVDQRQPGQYRQVNKRKNDVYTDYLYPHYLDNGTIIALKQGMGNIATFVTIDENGQEKKVFIPGQMVRTGMLSVRDHRIVWNEYTFDPRYGKVIYSVIKMYDINRHHLYQISKKSRYGSAGLSPDGKKVITVETKPDGRNSLLVISTQNGSVIKQFPNAENNFYVHPVYSDDGKEIVVVKKARKGKTIAILDAENGNEHDLWPLSYENVGYPVKFDHYVLYNSSYDGLDNIYAYDLSADRRYRVTNSCHGAYNAQVSKDGSKLIFNDYSREGQNVVSIDFNPGSWEPIEQVEPFRDYYINPLVRQEGNKNVIPVDLEQKEYPVSRYHLFNHLLDIYGWGPYITSINPDFLIGLRSQDIMSTTLIDAGYAYNTPERNGRWQAGISYQGLYPALNLRGYTGKRSVDDRFINKKDEIDTTAHIDWKESGIEFGIQIPLNLTRSKYYQNLNIGYTFGFNRITDYNFFARHIDQQANGDLIFNTYYLNYSRLLKISKRDIHSKFGQFVYLNYKNTPFGGDYLGGLFSSEVRFYFPGLFKHHSLFINSNFLYQDLQNGAKEYLFQSPVSFTRGYDYMYYRTYINNSLNYTLPLLYPDLHIGSLINIQRVYANLFLDVGSRHVENTWNYYRSIGMELFFDFNFMRYLRLFNAGIRYSYAMDDTVDPHKFQLLIGNLGF